MIRPLPLRSRILRALDLQPMTVSLLASLLCTSCESTRHAVRGLQEEGAIRVAGRVRRGWWRLEKVYATIGGRGL